jgi:hypothetical protein
MWRLNHFWRGFVSVPRALARQFECEKSKPPFDSRLFEDFGVHQSVMSSSGRTSVAVLPTGHVRIEEGAELAARPPRYELRCESKISFRDSSVRNSNAIASTVGSADSCLEPALSRYELAAVIYATGADRGMKTPKPVAVLNSGCCQRSGVCARSTGPPRQAAERLASGASHPSNLSKNLWTAPVCCPRLWRSRADASKR